MLVNDTQLTVVSILFYKRIKPYHFISNRIQNFEFSLFHIYIRIHPLYSYQSKLTFLLNVIVVRSN